MIWGQKGELWVREPHIHSLLGHADMVTDSLDPSQSPYKALYTAAVYAKSDRCRAAVEFLDQIFKRNKGIMLQNKQELILQKLSYVIDGGHRLR